jgi:hypothetical protein
VQAPSAGEVDYADAVGECGRDELAGLLMRRGEEEDIDAGEVGPVERGDGEGVGVGEAGKLGVELCEVDGVQGAKAPFLY